MAAVLLLAPVLLTVLLIAVAAAPAASEPQAQGLRLHPVDSSRFEPTARRAQGPVTGLRLLQEQEAAWPAWTFGPRAGERGRHGWSFGVRPGRGLKASAKLRF